MNEFKLSAKNGTLRFEVVNTQNGLQWAQCSLIQKHVTSVFGHEHLGVSIKRMLDWVEGFESEQLRWVMTLSEPHHFIYSQFVQRIRMLHFRNGQQVPKAQLEVAPAEIEVWRAQLRLIHHKFQDSQSLF